MCINKANYLILKKFTLNIFSSQLKIFIAFFQRPLYEFR